MLQTNNCIPMLFGEFPSLMLSALSPVVLGNLMVATALISQKGLMIRGTVTFPRKFRYGYVYPKMTFLKNSTLDETR